MRNLKISNEIRLVDFIILTVLSTCSFALYYKTVQNNYCNSQVSKKLEVIHEDISVIKKVMEEGITVNIKEED